MKNRIIFRYQPPIASNMDVYLVGDFNAWNPTSLKLEDLGGLYEIAVQLAPGSYKYHFLVNNKIFLDPNAETITVDNIVYSLKIVAPAEEFLYLVPFKIKDRFNYEEISIVGDFNKWKPNYNRLKQEDEYFNTTLFLTNGLYQYKYLAKDNRWFNEEEIKAGTDKVALDNRTKNSLLDTSQKSYITIAKSLLSSYDTNRIEFKKDIIKIYRYSEKEFEFKAILPDIKNIQVKLSLNNKSYELDFVASNGINSSFNKVIELNNTDLIYSYKLILKLNNIELWANQNTLSNNQELSSVFLPNDYEIFSINKDISNRIMYQIMPDRFCNGDSALNPDFSEKFYHKSKKRPKKESLTRNQEYYHLADWNEVDILTKNPYSENQEADWFVFYGGDLTGVESKIPYLRELGISLIYFNPIFKAKSPHRYDTIDFKCIDPHLGTNESFQSLVEELHQNDIKVIIDIALNHCGFDFFAFTDTIKNGDKSPYWSWYDWTKWPLPSKLDKGFNAEEYYQCWWGIKDLPEFNYDLKRQSPEENQITDIQQAQVNVELVNYLLDAMKYWVETVKIDGFRLDVPEEVPFWFWKLFRSMLKKVNPDIYIVGEIWNSADNWLQGQYFDAIMNYQAFKDPAVAYFFQKKISLKSFINRVSSGLIALPEYVVKSQMNLLGGHDTVRIRKLVDSNLDRLKLALIFQFTYIGLPHIYYGDEVFLDGNKDPDNRRPFPWDYESDSNRVELLRFYKALIKLRKNYKHFTDGKIKFLENQYLLIFERWISVNNSKVIVIINNTDFKVDISKYCKEYSQELLSKTASNHILEYGYYIAIKH